MTDDQINAAIAKALGWTVLGQCTCGPKTRGIPPGGLSGGPHIPNYSGDLNAMHEALKTLSPDQLWDVAYSLPMESILGFMATPRELAETFLIVIGKSEATDKDSLTVGATTEQFSVDQKTQP